MHLGGKFYSRSSVGFAATSCFLPSTNGAFGCCWYWIGAPVHSGYLWTFGLLLFAAAMDALAVSKVVSPFSALMSLLRRCSNHSTFQENCGLAVSQTHRVVSGPTGIHLQNNKSTVSTETVDRLEKWNSQAHAIGAVFAIAAALFLLAFVVCELMMSTY